MKLSRTGWNNVIIISVMLIILMINATNDKLFPPEDSSHNVSAEQAILPVHSVIVMMTITDEQKNLTIARQGATWEVNQTEHGKEAESVNVIQIEQLIRSWQESHGLVQAGDIIVEGMQGISVVIHLASNAQPQQFTVYPLNDQLLLFSHQRSMWLAMPVAMTKQLLL